MIELTIDGVPVKVAEGTTLFDAAREAGIEIPALCHDPRLDPAGVCRLCSVDIGERTLVAACVRPCEAGMEVKTVTPEIESHRRKLVDLLMADQPGPENDPRESTLGDNALLALARRYDAWGQDLPGAPGRRRSASSRRSRTTTSIYLGPSR